jgi:hypothetical protein
MQLFPNLLRTTSSILSYKSQAPMGRLTTDPDRANRLITDPDRANRLIIDPDRVIYRSQSTDQ